MMNICSRIWRMKQKIMSSIGFESSRLRFLTSRVDNLKTFPAFSFPAQGDQRLMYHKSVLFQLPL